MSHSLRHQEYLQSFLLHLHLIHQLHRQSTQELLPKLIQSLDLAPSSIQLVSSYLEDQINLFRFLSRNRFDLSIALLAISKSIQWRLESNIDFLSPSSLDPIYFENPVLFFHSELKDRFGRHSAILNLRYLTRSEDGSLDGLKDFIAWNWELARKSISDSNPHFKAPDPQPSRSSSSCPSSPSIPLSLQVTLIIDLKDASMNNLELELLPYLLHLVKDNFPDMVGTIFILNYGWMYAGMWQIVKRILTPAALNRIVFVSHSELLQYFDKSNLLVEHGGSVAHPHGALHNQFMNQFGKPAMGALTETIESRSYSRHPSVESIHDIFFSACNTPFHQASRPTTPHQSINFNHSHRRPSALNMSTCHPSQISSNTIPDGYNKPKGIHSEWSQSNLACPNFQLKFPIQTCHEEIGQDPSATLLPSDHLSGFSSSSSLSEASRRLRSSTHQDDDDEDADDSSEKGSVVKDAKRGPLAGYQKRKRDYFYIRLIIKFGYVFRALQVLLRLIAHRVLTPRTPHPQESLGAAHDQERDTGRVSINHTLPPRHHRLHHLHLHHLFLIINLQRKKMISSFGCLLFFLIFFKKKKL